MERGGSASEEAGKGKKERSFSRGIDGRGESHSFSIDEDEDEEVDRNGDEEIERRGERGSEEGTERQWKKEDRGAEKRITAGTADVGEKKRIGNYP